MESSMRSIIMRRVWYSFGIGVLTHRAFLFGAVFSVSLGLFRELVFVTRVVEQFLAVPVGETPRYVSTVFLSALYNGELLTLLTLLLMVVSVGWFAYHLRPLFAAAHLAPRY